MNLRAISCAVIGALITISTHAQTPVEIVNFDNLPDSLSAETITVGNATFSGGVVGRYYNVPTNKTRQYISAASNFPGYQDPFTCVACAQTITIRFQEPANNLHITVLNGMNTGAASYRYKFTSDKGQEFLYDFGPFYSNSNTVQPYPTQQPFAQRFDFSPWKALRSLTIAGTVVAVPGTLMWQFSLDDVEFTPKPRNRQRIVGTDLTDPSNPVRHEVILGTDVPRARFPTGSTFRFSHEAETSKDKWEKVSSTYVLGTPGITAPLHTNALFPTNLIVPFTETANQADKTFVATHKGDVLLSINPTNASSTLRPIQVKIVIEDPLSLGATGGLMPNGQPNNTTYDARINEYAHRAGVPPQYVKVIMYHEDRGGFGTEKWRYEPGYDQLYVHGKIGNATGFPHHQEHRLATHPNEGALADGVNLCRNAPRSAAGCIFGDLDDINARNTLPVRIACETIRPIVDGDKFISIREILDGRRGIPCPPSLPRGPRSRPVRPVDLYNVTAQTHFASSYGLMQVIWDTAMEASWPGYSNRWNPALLFDTPANLARNEGSIPAGTYTLSYKFDIANVFDDENPILPNSGTFAARMKGMVRAYNGGGPDAEAYAETVTGYLPSFLPQRNSSPIFGRTDCPPITITSSTETLIITPGDAATLGVATNAMPVAIRWFQGAAGDRTTLLDEGLNFALAVSPLQTTSYWVELENECGRTATASMQVSMQSPCATPAITEQPTSVTGHEGQTQTLHITGSGSGVTYAWYRGPQPTLPVSSYGNPIATTNTLTVTVETGITEYWAVVTNACGAITSDIVTITGEACIAPAVIQQPQSVTIDLGESTTLVVEVNDTASFQWWAEPRGEMRRALIGKTANSLTVTPTKLTTYWVTATTPCGTIISDEAIVTVHSCTPSIRVPPSNQSIAEGDEATLQVIATIEGDDPLSYQWYETPGGVAAWTLITDATTDTLSVQPAVGETWYRVRVSSTCGSVESDMTSVIVVANCESPLIIQDLPGEVTDPNAIVRVEATGTAPLIYQWYELVMGFEEFWWRAIAGATTATFTGSNDPYSSGYFRVEVTNACGSAMSSVMHNSGGMSTSVALLSATYTVAPNGARYLDQTTVTFTEKTKLKGHPRSGDRVKAVIKRHDGKPPVVAWLEKLP